VITLPADRPQSRYSVTSLNRGTGRTIREGDWVTANHTATDRTTRKDLQSSYDQGQKPQLYQAGKGQLIPALNKSVIGQSIGSRLLVVAPPAEAFGSKGSSALGVGKNDTLVFVIDIVSAVPADSTVTGTMLQTDGTMPRVEDNGKAPMTIRIPSAGQKPPARLRPATLIEGHGPQVRSGDTVVAQYTSVLWSTGARFDSSWDHQGASAFQIGSGSVIKGWDDGLVGQRAGSRVLLVVPPSLAHGDQAQGSIPADSTLVCVVDILGAA
jgi:FKBP-type peptidyl-prolyl cis-trans isomerase